MSKILRIKLIRPSNTKLALVKLIKECSGLGLKDSKDICDLLHSNPTIARNIPIRETEIDTNNNRIDYKSKFILGLKEVDGQFNVTGDTQWERDIKVLKLGLGDKSDYTNFVKDYIHDHFEDSENILKFALSLLTKQQIEEVFNKINIE